MIYEPGEDSFLLVSFIIKYAKNSVLDMGCGSGILALEAMKYTNNVLAADINSKAVEYCKNQGINAVKSNLFSNIKGRFGLILFNPPYLPKDRRENKKDAAALAGGRKGHEIIERFLKDAKKHIEEDGKILIVVSSLTGDAEKLFKKHGYKFKKLAEESYFFEKLKVYMLCC